MEERVQRLQGQSLKLATIQQVRPGLGQPSDKHPSAPMSPVPTARTFRSVTSLEPKQAEAHLGTLVSSRARWPPRSQEPLQMEAHLVISILEWPLHLPVSSRPKADVPECQANPGLQAPPASQKRQTGPQLPKPTCPAGRPGLGWGVCQPKLRRAPQGDSEGQRGAGGQNQSPQQKQPQARAVPLSIWGQAEL